jgi:hypothetical protein
MKTTVISIAIVVFAAAAASAQAKASASMGVQFPGLSAGDVTKLRTAKRTTPIPLPTWLPDGFKIERIEMVLGTKTPLWQRSLAIIYSRKTAAGKTQRFAIEAGFEGIGDLPYDATKEIRSAVGSIYLMYEPADPDGGGKIKNYAMTDWFDVGKTPYHYNGMYGTEPDDKSVVMISLADTEKILSSLKRF